MKIHKDRWGTNQGEKTNLGYQDGKLVFYSQDFENQALEHQRKMIEQKFDAAMENEEDD
jgi:hypothetical protein